MPILVSEFPLFVDHAHIRFVSIRIFALYHNLEWFIHVSESVIQSRFFVGSFLLGCILIVLDSIPIFDA